MNRGEWRQKLLDLKSWHADVDDDFVAEVNRAVIDVAYARLASEVPEALMPDTETVTLLADQTSTALGRTVSTTDDLYVLDLGPRATGSAIVVDGTWDGIMHIEVVRSNGDVLRFQCREFWLHDSQDAYDDHYLVSLDRPYIYTTDATLQFRIYQPYFYTKDTVTKLIDGRLFNTNRSLIRILPAGFARYANIEDYRGQSTQPVQVISRGPHFQMPAPNRTPTVGADPSENWATTQEAPGTFTYKYTYVWGRRAATWKAPGGFFDPMWESGPSPASAAYTVAAVGNDAVLLNGITNIDWQLKFDPNPATLRSGHSGWRKRIYRARTAVTSGGTTEANVEYPGVYFYLAEIDGDTTYYIDDGTAIPDYTRRLPESHGYWGWAAGPHQDQNYEIDLRVTRRPEQLQTDYDEPRVLPDFNDMLILLGLKYLSLLKKQPAEAADFEAQYTTRVERWQAREANPADFSVAIPWVPDYDTYYNQPYFYGRYSSN